MNKAIIAIVAVIIIAAGVFALSHNNKKTTTPATTNTTTPSTSSTTPSSSSSTSAANTITYSNSGFSPAVLTVKAGSQVTIKNSSSGVLQFDSDPHPQHTDDPELNVGIISAGNSKTFSVTITGSHGFHNHLSPNDMGTLVVE